MIKPRRVLIRWLISSVAALVTTGCASEPPPLRTAGKPVTSLHEIAGCWDVANFDGYTPTRLGGGVRQAFVHVSSGELGYRIECNSFGNAAHIDSDGFSTMTEATIP